MNHYLIYINKNFLYSFNLFLKKELSFFFSSVIELSASDNLNYTELNNNNTIIKLANLGRVSLYYHYYCYLTKLRLTLFNTHSFDDTVFSLDSLYLNCVWLEREISELFWINYNNKKDTRTLLLDYPKKNHPMLKDFPTESWGELYYDFLDKSLNYSEELDHTEL